MSSPQSTVSLSTEHLRTDLRNRSVRGGLLTLGSQGIQFLLQTVSTVVLARLLTPADFGLVAMVTAITGLAQAFADFGLSEATIQRQEISHDQINTLFWVNVAIGLALTVLTIFSAPLLVWFYRDPRLKDITLVVSLTFLIGGLRVQHDALLKRQMRFGSLAVRDVASYLIAVPLAITMAWAGAGYWALVVLPLALNTTQMLMSWIMARWVPGLPRRRAGVGSMIAFGGNVAASYLIINVNRNADNVLIGWYWGAGPLGLYSRAYNLLMLPVRLLSTSIGGVAIPAFSTIQHDPERSARYYLRAANLLMWIAAPVFGFLFVAATPVIVLVLGAKWQAAAPVFQILAISALGQLLLESTVWLLVGRGRSDRLFRLLLFASPVIIGSFVIGLPFGIRGVSLAGSLVLTAIFPQMLKFAFRGTALTLGRLWSAIVYPIGLCITSVLVAEAALYSTSFQRSASQLLIVGLAFAATYSFSVLLPPVRAEVASFRRMFGDLSLAKQPI